MKLFGIFLALFGITVILYPEFLAYLIGGFFLFLGVSLILTGFRMDSMKKNSENYVKFGNYKIFR